MLTNSFPADEGRFGGATVTMISKSGTNDLHGTLFEFLRNDKLNANRWLPGQTILQKDPLHRNQFGGTAGGPIVRNRTFIFGTYSGLRERTSVFANTATPLNAKERGGDLSATGGTAPVDPLNNFVAFPGRVIPVNRIDPVAKKILDTYIPFPNLLANGAFEAQIPHPKDTDEVLFKLDHNINQAHRLTGSLFYTTGLDSVGLAGQYSVGDARFQLAAVQLQRRRNLDRLADDDQPGHALLRAQLRRTGQQRPPSRWATSVRYTGFRARRRCPRFRWRDDSISTARFPARWRAAISTSFAMSSASAPPSTRCAWEARPYSRRWCTTPC